MTENESVKELSNELRIITSMIAFFRDFEKESDMALAYRLKRQEAMKMAVQTLEEIQNYRKIGTVEECRAAVEKQKRRKPEHILIKHGRHKWRRNENGAVDEYAWDDEYHAGVSCEICDKTVCVYCNPDYDQLTDCEENYWICPSCEKKMYVKRKYCDCGQKLDWGNEDV